MSQDMKVSINQSVFDIAIQKCGSIEAAFEIAQRNFICITDTLIPGQRLWLPDPKNKSISNYYAVGNLVPASDTDILSGTRTFDDSFDLTFR